MWRDLNLSDVKLKTLRENGYDAKVLSAVEGRKFEILKGNEVLKDVNAARYLLYAVINSQETELYPLYACLENDVQQDLLGATYISNNILQTKPEVIRDTPLAKDEIAILNNIDGKPEIAQYISEDLVKNSEFMNEMINREPATIREITKTYTIENIIAENSSLVNNPQFMAEAISKDVNAIKYADKEMLNNYEVFATSAKINAQVASYMLEHIEEFGCEAIKGAKDGSTERVRVDTIDELKVLLEKYGADGNRERQIRDQESQEREGFDLYKLKALVQILKKDRKISLNENALNIVLNSIDLTKADIERQLRENPKLVISQEQFGALPTPSELKQIIEKSQLEDKEIFVERLEKYEKFYTMAKEHKSKERKPKEKVEVSRETQEERDERLRTPDQEKIATERFIRARESIENKGRIIPSELLKRVLEKSELKDDKEAIAWLEEYTRFYEQQQEKTQEEVKEPMQEHNAELSINTITIIASRDGVEQVISYNQTQHDAIQLTPEQMHQLEVDLAARNVERENVQEVETPKRGIESLREGPEQDGQDR